MNHTAARMPAIEVQGEQFVYREGAQAGQPVVLRGVNATGDAKVPPFTGIRAKGELQALVDWGFNCVRLLFIWEAYEPERGAYDNDYLDRYEQAVQWAHEVGLYVIVDFHQDAFSRYALRGCGEGFPRWAMDPDLPQYEPCNDHRCEKWGLMATLYPSSKKENAALWNSFHNDVQGARTAFVVMAGRVAQRLAAYSHVVGYDMLNEPFGTDAQLTELFEAMAQSIRAAHPTAVLFVSVQALYSAAFSTPTLPKPSFDNCALAAHYYDAGVIMARKWLGVKPNFLLKNLLRAAQRWQVPMFLGEFGAPAGTWRGAAYVAALYDWMNERGISGTQWCYTPNWHPERKDGWNVEDLSIVDDQGQLRDNFASPVYKAQEK